MNRKKPLQLNKRGSTMALVLLVVVILLAMGAGLLNLGSQSRMMTARTSSEIAARCAADAGLTRAVFEMNEQLKVKPWNDSTLPQETCGYTNLSNSTPTYYSFTVSGDFSSGYTAESIGTSGRAERKVNATLQLRSIFEYAIFAKGIIDLKNGTTIDWYNFDADDEDLQLGTNSTTAGAINSKLGVTINGDVVVGVDGDPAVVIDSQNEAVITGETYAMTEEEELLSTTVPAYLQALPSGGALIGGTTVTTSAKYDSINVSNSEIATIDGAVTLYVIGDVILDNSAQVLIVDANTNPDASLTIYLGGNFECKNGALINNTTDNPQRLKIYGLDTCTSINFKTSSVFYGAIYAPNADVQLNAWVEYYGACVANSFFQSVNANFHYDASLRDASVDDEGVHFAINRWREQ